MVLCDDSKVQVDDDNFKSSSKNQFDNAKNMSPPILPRVYVVSFFVFEKIGLNSTMQTPSKTSFTYLKLLDNNS